MPCPTGYYGMMCRNNCSHCTSGKCSSQKGDCIIESSQILFDWPDVSNQSNSNVMNLSNDRIKAKHWIQVNGNGKITLKNCTNLENCNMTIAGGNISHGDIHLAHLIGKTHEHHVQVQKNNSLMMTALNSSIANLTTDIGKLSKQVSDQHQEIKKTNEIIPNVAILLESPSVIAAAASNGLLLPNSVAAQNVDVEKLENYIALPNTYQQLKLPAAAEHLDDTVDASNMSEVLQENILVGTDSIDGATYDSGVTQIDDGGKNEVLHIVTLQSNKNGTDEVSVLLYVVFLLISFESRESPSTLKVVYRKMCVIIINCS